MSVKVANAGTVRSLRASSEGNASRYTNEFKRRVIVFAEKHCNSEAERTFGVAESNIRRWKKNKSHIFARCHEGKKRRVIKRIDQSNRDFIYELTALEALRRAKLESTDLKHLTEDNETKSPEENTLPSQQASPPKMKVIRQATVLQPATVKPLESTDTDQDEVCLRWNSHHSNMKSSFPSLLQREQYVDVTLAAEGKTLKCHRLILSSCSPYFDEILAGISPFQHPVVFVNGVEFSILKALLDFMYAGEVHIEQNKLSHLLKVAEMLQIKGLAGKTAPPEDDRSEQQVQPVVQKQQPVSVKTEAQEQQQHKVKKETSPQKLAVKSLKPFQGAIAAVDPLALLQPTFFEESPEPFKSSREASSSPVKKAVPKKIRKRKTSEHEPSPPPVLYRKGTKSRPHVKVPRYYHNDYENVGDVKLSKHEEPVVEDAYDISKVKAEPIDIEDTDVGGLGDTYQTGKNVGDSKQNRQQQRRTTTTTTKEGNNGEDEGGTTGNEETAAAEDDPLKQEVDGVVEEEEESPAKVEEKNESRDDGQTDSDSKEKDRK